MDFLEKLEESVRLPNVYYHKFITSYKKNSEDVYVFCEGCDDLNYYCEQIERHFPQIEIHKCFAEGKNNVIKIWKFIDWCQYDKNRVLFFVDRDLSYWVGEPQYYDSNVYITEGYSFENDAVSVSMFLKFLEDIRGFANYTEEEKKLISSLFIDKWEKFIEGSYELMGYLLYKCLNAHEHTAKNISMRECLNFESESIWNKVIKGFPSEEYYKMQLEIADGDISEAIRKIKERFICEGEHYSVRGKWCIDFMNSLMDYIYDSGAEFVPSLYKGNIKRPKKTQLTSATIGPKIVPPKSLNDFLEKNIGKQYE